MSSKVSSQEVNLLDIIPVRLAEYETSPDDRITLLKPKFSLQFIQKYILPKMKRSHYKVHLDAFGSYVWRLCDGKNSVEKIGEILKQKFGDEIEPVYERLSIFMKQLQRGRFIELPLPHK